MMMMMVFLPSSICTLLFFFCTCTSATLLEHTFLIHNMTIERLCEKKEIPVVNGSFPGPTIYANEGDSLVVHVINQSPYNMSIHWHGVMQLLSCWSDGVGYITQCPIVEGHNFTYRFNLTGQEGTVWWHAHVGFERATVHGALIIYPRIGRSYPFPKPDEEVPIILGEWWKEDVVLLEKQLEITGFGPNGSDAFTINGLPGDLFACSSNDADRRFLKVADDQNNSNQLLQLPFDNAIDSSGTFKVKVSRGKTYLLRIVNAALNIVYFYKIANHNFTVVAVDATYTDPYTTDLLVITPGQTTDILFKADQPPDLYYMANIVYKTSSSGHFNLNPATAVIAYDDAPANSVPLMPLLPNIYDTPTVFNFFNNITGLTTGPFYPPVPQEVDERMFMTLCLNVIPCEANHTCQGPGGYRLAASMNNESFEMPTRLSILEAYYHKVEDIYTPDFPDEPLVKFNYTNVERWDQILMWTKKSTKVKVLKYNSTVEIVLQATSLVSKEQHPIHLHGYNFYVVAQGFGNYDPSIDGSKLNLVNPQMRNTISVPQGGWVVIRFRANNPGVWYMHCHNEGHVPIGLAATFIVEDGPTPSTTLGPPPLDLPQC